MMTAKNQNLMIFFKIKIFITPLKRTERKKKDKMRTQRWLSWAVGEAVNVGLMCGSHQGLCILLGLFCLAGGLRALFIQCLYLVYVFRFNLHVVCMWGV
jgi:hypothetical protein